MTMDADSNLEPDENLDLVITSTTNRDPKDSPLLSEHGKSYSKELTTSFTATAPPRRSCRARRLNSRFAGDEVDEGYLQLVARIAAPDSHSIQQRPQLAFHSPAPPAPPQPLNTLSIPSKAQQTKVAVIQTSARKVSTKGSQSSSKSKDFTENFTFNKTCKLELKSLKSVANSVSSSHFRSVIGSDSEDDVPLSNLVATSSNSHNDSDESSDEVPLSQFASQEKSVLNNCKFPAGYSIKTIHHPDLSNTPISVVCIEDPVEESTSKDSKRKSKSKNLGNPKKSKIEGKVCKNMDNAGNLKQKSKKKGKSKNKLQVPLPSNQGKLLKIINLKLVPSQYSALSQSNPMLTFVDDNPDHSDEMNVNKIVDTLKMSSKKSSSEFFSATVNDEFTHMPASTFGDYLNDGNSSEREYDTNVLFDHSSFVQNSKKSIGEVKNIEYGSNAASTSTMINKCDFSHSQQKAIKVESQTDDEGKPDVKSLKQKILCETDFCKFTDSMFVNKKSQVDSNLNLHHSLSLQTVSDSFVFDENIPNSIDSKIKCKRKTTERPDNEDLKRKRIKQETENFDYDLHIKPPENVSLTSNSSVKTEISSVQQPIIRTHFSTQDNQESSVVKSEISQNSSNTYANIVNSSVSQFNVNVESKKDVKLELIMTKIIEGTGFDVKSEENVSFDKATAPDILIKAAKTVENSDDRLISCCKDEKKFVRNEGMSKDKKCKDERSVNHSSKSSKSEKVKEKYESKSRNEDKYRERCSKNKMKLENSHSGNRSVKEACLGFSNEIRIKPTMTAKVLESSTSETRSPTRNVDDNFRETNEMYCKLFNDKPMDTFDKRKVEQIRANIRNEKEFFDLGLDSKINENEIKLNKHIQSLERYYKCESRSSSSSPSDKERKGSSCNAKQRKVDGLPDADYKCVSSTSSFSSKDKSKSYSQKHRHSRSSSEKDSKMTSENFSERKHSNSYRHKSKSSSRDKHKDSSKYRARDHDRKDNKKSKDLGAECSSVSLSSSEFEEKSVEVILANSIAENDTKTEDKCGAINCLKTSIDSEEIKNIAELPVNNKLLDDTHEIEKIYPAKDSIDNESIYVHETEGTTQPILFGDVMETRIATENPNDTENDEVFSVDNSLSAPKNPLGKNHERLCETDTAGSPSPSPEVISPSVSTPSTDSGNASPSALSSPGSQSCNSIFTDASFVSDVSKPEDEVVETEEQKLEREQRNQAIIAERLKNFTHITENIYLIDRKKSKQSKEVRRMVCDCTLTKEELKAGEKGCGEDCLNKMLMIECGWRCSLGDACQNKRFQRCEYGPVEVFNADQKGCGLRATCEIEPGTFIMEYVGEVFDQREFKRRRKEYGKDGSAHFYFMALKADQYIDSTRKGNISRFINHSCDPNAETQKWTVNGDIRVGFFATKLIRSGEEINFDYRMERYGREPQKCYCGSAICRGWLGESPEEKTREEKDEERKRGSDKKRTFEKKLLEDEELQEDLAELQRAGLRNKQDTLLLSRVMVRAESEDTRTQLLLLLLAAHANTPCLRLFMDYYGLSLLWSWMADLTSDIAHAPLKLLILKTLDILPITNRTQVVDSGVMAMVEKWSKQVAPSSDNSSSSSSPSISTATPEQVSEEGEESNLDAVAEQLNRQNISPDDTSSDSAAASDICASSAKKVTQSPDEGSPTSDLADEERNKKLLQDVVELAEKLLSRWRLLKEEFRIPRKQRVELMREHEREVEAEYRQYLDSERGRREIMERSNNRRDKYYDSWRNKITPIDHDKNSWQLSNASLAMAYDLEFAGLSKEERREKFAQKVAIEEEQRRVQENMWNSHVDRCTKVGLDPYHTPIVDPSEQYFWDTSSSNWVPLTPEMAYAAGLVDSPLAQQHASALAAMGGVNPGFDTAPVLNPHDVPTTSIGDPLPPVSLKVKLPLHWHIARDQYNRVYFYHSRSRQTQWQTPTEETRTTIPLLVESESESESSSCTDSDEEFSSDDDDAADSEVAKANCGIQGSELDETETLEGKIIRRQRGKKRHSVALVQQRVISPIRELDREMARKERREAKERAKHEARKERFSVSGSAADDEDDETTDTPPLEDSKVFKPRIKTKSKERSTTAMADNSEKARKIKDLFRSRMATFIVSVLNPYRRADCTQGRINTTGDFKYLARKLTHFVMVKELKQLPSIEDLECSESVKYKTKDFVRKYMSKYGTSFKRDPNDTKEY